MIHRLEITNFYSIRDHQVIDLTVPANVPADPYRLSPPWAGSPNRVPRVIAIFGANASGKSNVLRALSFVAWFARDSFSAPAHGWLPYHRFLENSAAGENTRIAVRMAGTEDLLATDELSRQCEYEYEIVLGGEPGISPHVVRESMRFWPLGKKKPQRLFERDASGNVKSGKNFPMSAYKSALKAVLRPNASVISTLFQLQHPESTVLWNAANQLVANIFLEKQDPDETLIANIYYSNPELAKLLNREIVRIDLGVREAVFENTPTGPVATFHHAGLSQPLPMNMESHGTRLFLRLFPALSHVLAVGGVAVLDELDLAIHPSVLPEIVRWFHDPERNTLGAQLWFTCQNPSVLECLIKEEILFCQKDNAGKTQAYMLSDIKGVRRSDNFYKKYLSGIYGAIPVVG